MGTRHNLTLMLSVLLTATLCPPSFAQDIDYPAVLGQTDRDTLDRYGYLQDSPTGQEWIIYGAAIGAGADALYHITASKLLSRSKWLRIHCQDCKPADTPELFKRILADLPGFAGTGAVLGSCGSSGPSANSACLGGLNSIFLDGARTALVKIRGDKEKGFRILDHVAGQGLMALLWDQALPRGIVVKGGTCTVDGIVNGAGEVFGEALIGSANYATIDTFSRILHSEPVNIKKRFVDGIIYGGIPVGVEHLTLVLTLGARFKISEADRKRILDYTKARTGLDNTLAMRHADTRLAPLYMPNNGPPGHGLLFPDIVDGINLGNQVVVTGHGAANENTFLLTLSHEIMHVRQFQNLGLFPIFLVPRGFGDNYWTDPLEQVPQLLK